MKKSLEAFFDFVGRPVYVGSRPLLALLVLPLALSFFQPLWHIRMVAPQYPNGLDLWIWSYKLQGGHGGHDVDEINTLNHYIGMHHIDRQQLTDLDWIPFAFGLLCLLGLRVAAVGNVRSLIDLVVVTTYVSLFAFARFILKMWSFGHDLDPTAPFKVEPFTPAILGGKQVANFHTTAGPAPGSWLVGLYATGVGLVLLYHLIRGFRDAHRTPARPV